MPFKVTVTLGSIEDPVYVWESILFTVAEDKSILLSGTPLIISSVYGFKYV